jgi:hypothetical protein
MASGFRIKDGDNEFYSFKIPYSFSPINYLLVQILILFIRIKKSGLERKNTYNHTKKLIFKIKNT